MRGHASLPPASDAAAAAETRGVGTRLVRSKGDSEGTANARDVALFFFHDSALFFPSRRVFAPRGFSRAPRGFTPDPNLEHVTDTNTSLKPP
jgi:hypothetical protein